MALNQCALLQFHNTLAAGGVDVRFEGDAQIAHDERAHADLFGENAGWQGFHEDTPVFRILLLKRAHQIMHHHELITGEKYRELGIRHIAVQIRNAVNFRNRERHTV